MHHRPSPAGAALFRDTCAASILLVAFYGIVCFGKRCTRWFRRSVEIRPSFLIQVYHDFACFVRKHRAEKIIASWFLGIWTDGDICHWRLVSFHIALVSSHAAINAKPYPFGSPFLHVDGIPDIACKPALLSGTNTCGFPHSIYDHVGILIALKLLWVISILPTRFTLPLISNVLRFELPTFHFIPLDLFGLEKLEGLVP
mmetsp:Transcript_14962/g.36634  ORF Transcript_14962/g.36634 Transcript_14962/m.36634 type:complete len:200 (+) Transcript_14962:1944-2543(+)